MKKHNEEPDFLLRGFADGDAFVDELLKQVDDFSHSIWKSVAAETENHMARVNALDRFANAIERVMNSVLSETFEAAKSAVEQANRLGRTDRSTGKLMFTAMESSFVRQRRQHSVITDEDFRQPHPLSVWAKYLLRKLSEPTLAMRHWPVMQCAITLSATVIQDK